MGKKIIYIANMRLPNERPHGLQIMKTCEALKKKSLEIELWTASRKGVKGINYEEIFNFFGVKNRFEIKKLFVFDFLPSWWKIGFYLESFSFFISVFFKLLSNKKEFVIYTRDEMILFLSCLFKNKIFWESHMMPRSRFLLRTRLKNLKGIITISKSLKDLIVENNGIASDKIIVAHDAVDLDRFGKFLSKQEARELLKLPKEKKIIVYAGGLFQQKGVYVLLESSLLLGNEYFLILVGGVAGDETEKIKNFIEKKNIHNIILTGYIPNKDIKNYLSASDVLVLPNSSLDERTNLFTSPLKLFEYMSSNRPIVASSTITIKEILENGKNAVLVEPDNPESLTKGIEKIFSDKKMSDEISKQAFLDVFNYTWDKRADLIINFINK